MRGLGVACKGVGFQHSKRADANRQKPQIPVHVIPFLLIRCKPLMIPCTLHQFFPRQTTWTACIWVTCKEINITEKKLGFTSSQKRWIHTLTKDNNKTHFWLQVSLRAPTAEWKSRCFLSQQKVLFILGLFTHIYCSLHWSDDKEPLIISPSPYQPRRIWIPTAAFDILIPCTTQSMLWWQHDIITLPDCANISHGSVHSELHRRGGINGYSEIWKSTWRGWSMTDVVITSRSPVGDMAGLHVHRRATLAFFFPLPITITTSFGAGKHYQWPQHHAWCNFEHCLKHYLKHCGALNWNWNFKRVCNRYRYQRRTSLGSILPYRTLRVLRPSCSIQT